MTYEYEMIRLSKHFILLDFMYDRDTYMFGAPLNLLKVWHDENERAGRKLCEELLEPLITRYGPCSIAGAFWPAMVRTANGHYKDTPHHWDDHHGAAADVCWHDWVNSDRPPIALADDVDKNTSIPFDRIISYAGSEFLCMAVSGGKHPRYALHENIRVPGHKHTYKTWGDIRSRALRSRAPIPDRPDWRRGPRETVHITNNSIRPHHIRVGRYFTLLDFCHNSRAIGLGINTVPANNQKQVINVARMFAEVIDPLVEAVGRVSVLRGTEPRGMPDFEHAALHDWDRPGGRARVEFLLPVGADPEKALDILERHPSIAELDYGEHPTGSHDISLTINLFAPRHRWTSATEDEGF